MAQRNDGAFLRQVLSGQEEAVQFCLHLLRISQVVDDLHDRDKAVTTEQVKAFAWEALIELPSNAFYQRHFHVLHGLVRGALVDWIDSAALESTRQGHDLTLAFVLRDGLSTLITQCAYIIGGYSHMVAVSPAVRRYCHNEPLDAYLSEFFPDAAKGQGTNGAEAKPEEKAGTKPEAKPPENAGAKPETKPAKKGKATQGGAS